MRVVVKYNVSCTRENLRAVESIYCPELGKTFKPIGLVFVWPWDEIRLEYKPRLQIWQGDIKMRDIAIEEVQQCQKQEKSQVKQS